MSVTKSSPPAGHVAACVFPFASHPMALFGLVCRLAKEAPQLQFSFLCTQRSNSMVLSNETNILPTNIKTYDVDNGSPEGIDHLTLDHALEGKYFFKQFPGNFRRGIDTAVAETGGRSVTFLIIDACFSFDLGKLAEEMNVPWVAFMVPAPHDLAVWFQKDLIQQLYTNAQTHDDHPEDQVVDIIPGLPPVPFKDFQDEVFQRNPSSPVVQILSSMAQKITQASAIVWSSCEELNPSFLTNYLKSKAQNLLFVGSLNLSGTDATGHLTWLDRQKTASVVYISFGTVAAPGREELEALAEALEERGVPFLWSLKDKFKEYLPDGFIERTRTRGKVVPWASQRKVLGHRSIGVHVTQSGYGSVLDSILCGVPMICRSVWADNHLNAKMVEEVWGIGVRFENRVITKSGMLKCLDMIFQQDKGKEIRQAATALKQVLEKAAGPDGVAAKHFETLLQIISEK
ncbi:anthocyanidin 3-O-glucosyltransferase 7-like [Hevea brasiliensis]|nr:anthocyanidin 3-O-glucosyltransferase 7-like [Hevea brasiliensis]